MPQTKKQEIVYTVMMVCVMVYGMVCYNIALDVGGMQNFIFLAAFSELPIMGVIAFLLDTFLVGPAAMRIATGWFTPGKDKQVFLIMAISCLSAWMMPADELFRHAAVQGQPQRQLCGHLGADHHAELPRCVPVAAGSCRPAGAHGVWRRITLHQEKVKRRDTLLNLY